ncbi:MAG: DUF4164 family protein [Pseudomonadota bacterium]
MSSIEESAQALDEALGRLERALDSVFARAGDPVVTRKEIAALVADRAKLAEELDEAMAREQELQALADEASSALGSAIDEVRAALERDA